MCRGLLTLALLLTLAAGCGDSTAATTDGGGDARPADASPDAVCTPECTVGATRCEAGGAATCESPACPRWGAPVACLGPGGCEGGACVPCSGASGTFYDQPLAVGSETRHYYLHVPPSYACTSAWPLLIDFHGTAGGTEADQPETYYALPDLVEVAVAEGLYISKSLSSKPRLTPPISWGQTIPAAIVGSRGRSCSSGCGRRMFWFAAAVAGSCG